MGKFRNRERVKSIALLVLFALSVIQVGALWTDTGSAYPFAPNTHLQDGGQPAGDERVSVQDGVLALEPYRVSVCDGAGSHYIVSRRGAEHAELLEAESGFVADILGGGALRDDIPVDSWASIATRRGVMYEFAVPLRQDVLAWATGVGDSTAGGGLTEIRKIVVAPDDETAALAAPGGADSRAGAVYALARDRVLLFGSQSHGYDEIVRMTDEALAEALSAIEDVRLAEAAGATAGDRAPGLETGAGATAKADALAVGAAGGKASADTRASGLEASAGGSVSAGASAADGSGAGVSAASGPGAANGAQAAGGLLSGTPSPAPTEAPMPRTAVHGAWYSAASTAVYATASEIGQDRLPGFLPDTLAIASGPEQGALRGLRLAAPADARDRLELEGIILGNDTYSYTRTTDSTGAFVFSNVTSVYRLYPGGYMDYRFRQATQPGEKGRMAQALGVASAFVRNIESQLLGGATLYLSGIVEDGSELSYRFTFDYILDDYPVFFQYTGRIGDEDATYRHALEIEATEARVLSCQWLLVDLFFGSDTHRVMLYADTALAGLGGDAGDGGGGGAGAGVGVGVGVGAGENGGAAEGAGAGENGGAGAKGADGAAGSVNAVDEAGAAGGNAGGLVPSVADAAMAYFVDFDAYERDASVGPSWAVSVREEGQPGALRATSRPMSEPSPAGGG